MKAEEQFIKKNILVDEPLTELEVAKLATLLRIYKNEVLSELREKIEDRRDSAQKTKEWHKGNGDKGSQHGAFNQEFAYNRALALIDKQLEG